METNIKAIQITAKDATYVNIGVVVNKELCFFQLDFIKNSHNWGVVLVNPDGKSVTRFAPYGKNIFGVSLMYEEAELYLDVIYDDEKDMYDIYFDEKEE